MQYRTRMRLSIGGSVAIHVIMLIAVGWQFSNTPVGAAIRAVPITLRLQRVEEKQVKRLVDAVTPTEETVKPTDLIAPESSRAADQADTEGEEDAPHVDEIAEFEAVARAQPEPTPTERPAAAAETLIDPPKTRETTPDLPLPTPTVGTVAEKPRDEAPRVADEREKERTQVAKLDPRTVPEFDPRPSRGRKRGGAQILNLPAFEAEKHKFAPYMKDVQRRVEAKWRAALELQYSGTSKAKTVVDCAIDAQGNVVSVEIVEPGRSPTYAALCKEAIERAGPFPPFPFKVSDAYRNKNLEIRWTFSFL